MTLAWAARIGLALWMLSSIAFYGEGFKARGSAGLRVLNASTEVWIVGVLIWVAWWS